MFLFFQGLFFIDNATGTLRVKAQMPTKVNNSMIVKVMAFDNGVPQANDSAQLLIYFANVFKNAPLIDPPVIKASIKEVIEKHSRVHCLLVHNSLSLSNKDRF